MAEEIRNSLQSTINEFSTATDDSLALSADAPAKSPTTEAIEQEAPNTELANIASNEDVTMQPEPVAESVNHAASVSVEVPAPEVSSEPVAEQVVEVEAAVQVPTEELEETLAREVQEIAASVSVATEPAAAKDTKVESEVVIEEKPVNVAPVLDAEPASKPIVMIVDDSPTIRKLVSMTLSKNGFEVITANDGVDALKLLARQRPDIILTDINMPRLNGYKLCKFVKKQAKTKLIPILMLSAKDGVVDKMKGKMAGANGFISKPFESADLVHQVRQQLLSATNV